FASGTVVKAIVPAGTSYQVVSRTCNSVTAYTRLPFVVTFPGAKSEFGPNDFKDAGQFRTSRYPADFAVSDIDGDGKPDIITANFFDRNISVLQNTCDSSVSFVKKKDYPSDFSPQTMITA